MSRSYAMIHNDGVRRMRLPASAATLRSRRALAVLFSFLLVLAAPCRAGEPAEGSFAPALRADLIGGGKFDLAAARGKVVVLNFWASWCEPCMEEMPALDAFYRAHRADGLEVLGISVDAARDLDKVKDAAKKISFRTALLADAKASGYGRIWRVPVTFVIDRRGILRFSGWKSTDKLDLALLDKFVSPLLREPEPGTATPTLWSSR